MSREIIASPYAPAAIGPYSQAVRAGELLFLSGQIGLDPKTGETVPGGIEEETRQVIANLRAVMQAAGGDLDAIVSCRVYLQNMSDFAAFNRVYGEAFGEQPPARATIEVAGLPRGALVEIEAQAWLE